MYFTCFGTCLGPSLFVSNQLFVFEVNHHYVAFRKCVLQTTSIWGADDLLLREMGLLLEYTWVVLTKNSNI